MADSTAKPPAVKKTPLDILENVLEDAKSASKNKKATIEAEEEKKQREELAHLREQKEAQDEVLIQEQLAKMKEVGQMPSEKARKAQDEAEETESEKQKSSQEGYEIHQLKHTKV